MSNIPPFEFQVPVDLKDSEKVKAWLQEVGSRLVKELEEMHSDPIFKAQYAEIIATMTIHNLAPEVFYPLLRQITESYHARKNRLKDA